MLVFDLSDRQSFLDIQEVWLPEVEERFPSDIKMLLVGNKFDLALAERSVSYREA